MGECSESSGRFCFCQDSMKIKDNQTGQVFQLATENGEIVGITRLHGELASDAGTSESEAPSAA